jgi:hypothetical protein
LITNKEKYPTNHELIKYSDYKHLDWADPDLFLYEGYLQKPNYDSYFLYEYDTICNVSIDSFFNTNLDFFGNNISDPAPEDWWWVEKYRQLNVYNIHFKYLFGYGASTCVYMTNDIISKCAKEVIENKHLYNNMLSEVRGGTLVSQFTNLKKGKMLKVGVIVFIKQNEKDNLLWGRIAPNDQSPYIHFNERFVGSEIVSKLTKGTVVLVEWEEKSGKFYAKRIEVME